MCVSVCKCDECSFFNYCINMDFESVNKDLLLFIKLLNKDENISEIANKVFDQTFCMFKSTLNIK